jgi:hypothetical protein
LPENQDMDKKYFPLSSVENNRVVKIVQVAFGFVCIAVAVFWLIFNIRSMKTYGTLWITIIFLSGFGFYQIWAGIGRAIRFIEISSDTIRLKKTAVFPTVVISASEIQKIEVFPFNLIFILKTGEKNVLRFSSTYHETNEKIKEEIFRFTEINSISIENVEEKL